MTALTATAARRPAHRAASIDLGPLARAVVGMMGFAFTVALTLAIVRFAAGLAPSHPNTQNLAVLIHVSAVLPAVPLGAWLMLARKGTPRHKQLGKV